MALKLGKQDQEFRNTLIFHGDPKTIDLNRVLLNLFMLIKYDGVRPRARVGRKDVTPETLVKRLVDLEGEGLVKGFEGQESVVRWWVMTNLVDLVNRGKAEKEAVASLKAVHLNSYKFRNQHHVRDYNIAEQVYAMLCESPEDIIKQLREFLSEGWDQFSEGIDERGELDLDTLGILRIVEKVKDDPAGDNQFRPARVLCHVQARLLADDVRRLLVYRQAVPRHVLLEYLRTVIGLHVGLYLLKLFKMLPDWVASGDRYSRCKVCPAAGSGDPSGLKECPYQPTMVVDCGDDPEAPIAKLAEEDATFFYARIHDYVRSVFSINMSLQYLNKTQHQKVEDIDDALGAIRNNGEAWNQYFRIRIQNLLNNIPGGEDGSEGLMGVLDPVLALGLPSFDTFVELITQARASFHFKYHRELLDSLFQRNKESGLIWAGRSRKHGRRFWLSSRLLETMVQLSVLQTRTGEGGKTVFYSEPVLIDTFLHWMQERYGFIINGVDHARFRTADVSAHQAFKKNVINLKERLREIGFFNVLSDAYIMQRIRPRYHIKESGGHVGG